MKTTVLTLIILSISFLFMGLGLILSKGSKKKELKGSCGGPLINPDCCLGKNKECKDEKEKKAP